MIDACPSRDSVAGAPHVFEGPAGNRTCAFCGCWEPKLVSDLMAKQADKGLMPVRESTWWHCTGCGQTRFTHTVPKQPCEGCGQSATWMPGKVRADPSYDKSQRRPWQLHDSDGNLLGEYVTIGELSMSLADKLRFCEDRELIEDVLKYRIKNTMEVTIEKGLLTCPLCGGHDFILVEGGYDRIDRTTFDPVHGKLILANFQGFSEGGDGETMLSCVSDGCVADSRFPIPEGIEVDYD